MRDKEVFKNAPRTGRLFTETDVQVVRKGTIAVPIEPYTNENGVEITEEDRYFSILLFTKRNSAGEVDYQKYELAMSVGKLYINEKTGENSPDIDGPITIDLKKWKFCGWKKTATNNKEYTKCTLYEKEEPESTGVIEQNTEAPMPVNDEDIPF